ncbi:uncharacterized protein [Euphorbia lathyris]|uniref:uncharacterized protein n=1 Tax=Euphorbia lathyris TaxID=212925 RepID=UPI003314449C
MPHVGLPSLDITALQRANLLKKLGPPAFISYEDRTRRVFATLGGEASSSQGLGAQDDDEEDNEEFDDEEEEENVNVNDQEQANVEPNVEEQVLLSLNKSTLSLSNRLKELLFINSHLLSLSVSLYLSLDVSALSLKSIYSSLSLKSIYYSLIGPLASNLIDLIPTDQSVLRGRSGHWYLNHRPALGASIGIGMETSGVLAMRGVVDHDNLIKYHVQLIKSQVCKHLCER